MIDTVTRGLKIHRAADRGSTRLDWLDARHAFSFGRFIDRSRTGFRALRVINDDRIAPGGGFGMHPHEEMEIVTYIVQGRLAHKDSMGNASEIGPGQVQRMTAGTGVLHSEFNPSPTEPTRLLQIWLHPERPALDPGYEEGETGLRDRPGEFVPIVTPDGRGGSLRIHQDATIEAALLPPGARAERDPGRHVWVQVVRGDLALNGVEIAEGDGVEVEPGVGLVLEASNEAEVLVFDLA